MPIAVDSREGRLMAYGRCQECEGVRWPRLFHEHVEYEARPITEEQMRAMGGTWHWRIVCENGHNAP